MIPKKIQEISEGKIVKSFVEKLRNLGPGALVAAAFIGPGTITTCTISGASMGYALLWAMLFSTIATIIFQEMSGRLGIVTQGGLGEALRKKLGGNKILLGVIAILVICAIFIGNCAYETGNITGGSAGLNAIFPDIGPSIWGLVIGVFAFALLFSGSYKYIEKFLIALVIIMSVVFIATAVAVGPNMMDVLKGMFIPTLPKDENGWLTIIGLIGTTVVPYNIFLHASSTAKKWSSPESVKYSRWDTIISIGLGGIISMCVIIAASAAFYGTGVSIKTPADMAVSLEPLLGGWSKIFFGIGIFSAGFSSAITAPLSAAFATSGILGWSTDMKGWKFKSVWAVVLALGTGLAVVGLSSPTQIILFAQAANAIILPLIAVLLTWTLNDKKLMGEYSNKWFSNVLSIVVIVVTLAISYRSMSSFAASFMSLFK